jgi:hypothetical protein
MKTPALVVACLLCGLVPESGAQITFSGQTAAHFFQSAATPSSRTVNSGHPSFGWEAEIFADAAVTDNVVALATLRGVENRPVDFDYIVLRLTDVTPLHLTLQAGKFDLPFGNLGERRYPRRNNFFGLPLIHEYRTALPNYYLTESGLVANRAMGNGMRLLDLGMYGVGAMVSGSEGIFEYAFSLTSGTVSSTSYQSPNAVDGLGKVVRLAITPTTGFTIGGAYAWGPYLVDQYLPPSLYIDLNSYVQKAMEVDVEFSRGHFVFYGEGVYNVWPVALDPRDVNLKVFGYYLEGKYTIMPRLSVAMRVSGLRFGSVLLGSTNQPWDDNVTEWEGGIGYFVDRNVILKLIRRETRIQSPGSPKDHLTALQIAVSY